MGKLWVLRNLFTGKKDCHPYRQLIQPLSTNSQGSTSRRCHLTWPFLSLQRIHSKKYRRNRWHQNRRTKHKEPEICRRYSPDFRLRAEATEELRQNCTKKKQEMGLNLNISKTECMVVSKNEPPTCNLDSKGTPKKQVQNSIWDSPSHPMENASKRSVWELL